MAPRRTVPHEIKHTVSAPKSPPLPKLDLARTPTIPEYFRNRNVFITGATGFVGKVLLEKLLRSCPHIGTLFILMRSKRGVNPAERLAKLKDLPIFDRLKRSNPRALDKITVVLGDSSEVGLGIEEGDLQILKETVSIVFHGAASVRFDDPLKKSIFMNTRSALEVVKLAKEMKQLQVLLHISTAYCNADKKVIGEIIYPPRADWRKMIQMAETMDNDYINTLQDKIINGFPNTYTFTKSLAEDIMYDHRSDLNIVVLRPSIILSAASEPLPGWVDSMNGPIGIMLGVGTGFLHTLYGRGEVTADWVSVDQTVKAMIVATWYKAHSNQHNQCFVLNAGYSQLRPISYETVIESGKKMCKQQPWDKSMWYPFLVFTPCLPLYYVTLVLFHLIPGCLIDIGLAIAGQKFRLMKLYRRAYIANMALSTFMLNEWTFLNNNFLSLRDVMQPEDETAFTVDLLYDIHFYLKLGFYGIKQFILREKPETCQSIRRKRARLNRFRFAHYTVSAVSIIATLYVLWLYCGIITEPGRRLLSLN